MAPSDHTGSEPASTGTSPNPSHTEPGKAGEALREVADERRRQVEVEGWTPEHDDEHGKGEMAKAAACYALGSRFASPAGNVSLADAVWLWPWDGDWWKPTGRRRELIKAAALIVAEIERLDRASPPPPVGETL